MKSTLFVAVLMSCASLCPAQEVWQLAGSTTVAGALQPKQSELETRGGHRVEFVPTSSALGLEALAEGSADIAMISSPLSEIAADVNDRGSHHVDLRDFQAAVIGAVNLRFIVNPHNPIRKVTAAQLADLLCGRILSWSEIGGLDQPVQVVSLGAPSALLRDNLMHGKSFPKNVRLVLSADRTSSIVAANQNAIGIISEAHKRGLTSILQTDVILSAPLFLVTKGDPKPEQTKLIEAARAILAPAN
jgi:ABC-type phosphate transport system substrate-binding protein